MRLEHFDDLLPAAGQQPEPQRLLMVLTCAELPADASPEQQQAFAQGSGGTLVPRACVDRLAGDLASFSVLQAESRQMGVDWDIVFVSTLSGRAGHAPSSDEAVQPLKMMLEQVKAGSVGHFLAVARDGSLVQIATE